MFRLAHGGASALLWLCMAERMAGRRKRFAYGVKDWSLICSLAALIFCFLHGSISLFVRGWPRCYDALASGVNADFSDGKGRLLSKGVALSLCLPLARIRECPCANGATGMLRLSKKC